VWMSTLMLLIYTNKSDLVGLPSKQTYRGPCNIDHTGPEAAVLPSQSMPEAI